MPLGDVVSAGMLVGVEFKFKGVEVPGLKKRPRSESWYRFAASVVERAGILDDNIAESLLRAFATVPRDQFVAEAFNSRALDDVALPIGFGQTISRPSTVARMLGVVGIQRGMNVLEIGCGSGYCSAVMAAVGARVYAVECIGLLAQRTRRLLDSLGYQNVLIRTGDGQRGWAEHGPYDAIVVSAAFEKIPPELFKQLIPTGGRLVAPVGDSQGQTLTVWETSRGETSIYQLEPCKFVEGQC